MTATVALAVQFARIAVLIAVATSPTSPGDCDLCAALVSNHALPISLLCDVLGMCPARALRPRYPSYDYLPGPVVKALRGNLAMSLLLLTDPELSALPWGARRRIAVSRVWPSVVLREVAA